MESDSQMPFWCWKTIAQSRYVTMLMAKNGWVTIGMDAAGRVLVVVYAWRGNDIISARPATPGECRQYTEDT